jgi:hypothetical protein
MDKHKDENKGYVIAPIRANVQYPKDAKELAHSVARWWERSPEEDKSDSESINHCVGYMCARLIDGAVNIGISFCNIKDHYCFFEKEQAVELAKFKASKPDMDDCLKFIKRISRMDIIEVHQQLVWTPCDCRCDAITAETAYTLYMFNYLPIEQIARFIERAHRYFADKQFSESAIAIENLVARELRKLKDEVEEVEDESEDNE